VLTSILAFVAAAHNNVDGSVVDCGTAAAAASTTAAFSLLLSYSLGYSTPLLLVAGTGGQALAKLKGQSGSGNNGNTGGLYQQIGPWVTPITGAILLWYGTTGLLTSVFGDPSLFGLPVLE
jgi:cytochrome c-type biogenesis protein